MIIDLHSDTIYALWDRNDNETLSENSLSVNTESIRCAGAVQCLALFNPLKRDDGLTAWQRVNALHDRFVSEVGKAGLPISDDSIKEGSVILTTEEGGSIEGRIERLETLKDWGVRIFGLTWNYENELAYPNSKDSDAMQKGLKAKGIEAVKECNRLGIALDVSHLSDGGVRDVARYSSSPFFATHSNCRAIMDVPSNLPDDLIRLIADKGGAIGLNFCPSFLSSFKDGEEHASRIDDMVRHVMHLYTTGGEDVLAIGSDFDGISGKLEIAHPDQMTLLFDALSKKGLSPRTIDKMTHENAIRVFIGA